MPEYQDIYDIHRNLTGRTVQRGKTRKADEFILVVHLLLFDKQGRFLVQKRVKNKASWPDMWDISLGGIAQSGDDSRSAVMREAEEELGLHLDFTDTEPIFSFRNYNIWDDYWIAQIDSEHLELKLQPEEVAEAKWVTKPEWETLLQTHQVIPYMFQWTLFELYEKHFPGTRIFPFGSPAEIRGALFDMDGLLLDTERVCSETWDKAAELVGFADVQRAKMACLGLNHDSTVDFFEKTYGKDFDYQNFLDTARTLTKEALAQNLPVKEGASEILQFLKEKGVKLALASSTREVTVRKQLEKAGLLQYFDAVITGDMVQNGKPNPEIFQKACHALNLEPETCITFEDSINGIRSAYRAKTYPIHIPDIQPENQETIALSWKKFPSLTDAKKFLEKIL
ncbi:MAG: HAD-IA family hydrolase [Oscillospiraceae bacterium]|nr:HAD-IA family hydrolase [Oscillospiraceae bacterium]